MFGQGLRIAATEFLSLLRDSFCLALFFFLLFDFSPNRLLPFFLFLFLILHLFLTLTRARVCIFPLSLGNERNRSSVPPLFPMWKRSLQRSVPQANVIVTNFVPPLSISVFSLPVIMNEPAAPQRRKIANAQVVRNIRFISYRLEKDWNWIVSASPSFSLYLPSPVFVSSLFLSFSFFLFLFSLPFYLWISFRFDLCHARGVTLSIVNVILSQEFLNDTSKRIARLMIFHYTREHAWFSRRSAY